MCAGLLASPFNNGSKLLRYVRAARPWKSPTDRPFPWPCFRSRFQARFLRPVLAYSAPSPVLFSGPDSGPVFGTGIRSALMILITNHRRTVPISGPDSGPKNGTTFPPFPAFLGLGFGVGIRPLKWNHEPKHISKKCLNKIAKKWTQWRPDWLKFRSAPSTLGLSNLRIFNLLQNGTFKLLKLGRRVRAQENTQAVLARATPC